MAAQMPEGKRAAKAPRTQEEKDTTPHVVIILEQAAVEVVKTKKGYELLNCDEHHGIHKKYKKDPAESRPDILHQCLLTLLDSPLNKAGKLQVYVQTKNRTLIEISPHIRIPRTFKRFAGLMVQLMQKMRIRAADSNQTLMRIIKNPVTAHLPTGAPIYGTHMKGELVDPLELAASLPNGPVCFVFGAMSKGFISGEDCEKLYSFSQYPLSASVALSRLMQGFEHKWGIL
ncbi:unnamed protein product [Symbiodinium sp. KB8]|nr:unnamed protein product [Symbiodinium sp. KB8]